MLWMGGQGVLNCVIMFRCSSREGRGSDAAHCLFPESDGRRTADREAAFLSDLEDELTDSQKTSKHSEIYCATVPSIDSAMSSWDGSGCDAGYSSQGERRFLMNDPLTSVVSNHVCVLQGRTSTKHPIYYSTPTSGSGRSTAARPAPARRAWSTTQRCTMGGSLRTTGTRYQSTCTRTHLLLQCSFLPVTSSYVSAALKQHNATVIPQIIDIYMYICTVNEGNGASFVSAPRRIHTFCASSATGELLLMTSQSVSH